MKARVAMLEALLKRGEAAPGGGKVTVSSLASLNEDMLAKRRDMLTDQVGQPMQNPAKPILSPNRHSSSSHGAGESGDKSVSEGAGGTGRQGSGNSDASSDVKVCGASGKRDGKGNDSVPPKANLPEPPPPTTTKGKGKGKGVPPKAPPKAPPKSAEAKQSGPRPRKADVQPRSSMKKLFWSSFVLSEEIMSLSRGTIWGAIEEDGMAEFNSDYLEELFGEYPAGRSSRLFGGATQKKARARVRVFEESRRRQVCVMVARLPAIDETIQAVFEMDDVRLNRDQVELLLANAPTTDELAALRSKAAETEHDSDEPLDWDDAEAFILRLSGVPAFALRLQIWAFENSFDERFDVFQGAASDVCSACETLRLSPVIQRLLGLALAVGNYLNAGTSRGRADGFTVEALAQMRTVKASKPGQVLTLVDYIVQDLESSHPGELDTLFVEGGEAQLVHNASRHKLADLNVELSAYVAQADGLVKRTASSHDDELDIRSLRVESRVRELGELQKLFEKADEDYRQLCTWFHEGQRQGPKRPSDEFFALWDGFFKAVRVALTTTLDDKARRKKSTPQCHRSLQRLKRSYSTADVPSPRCFDAEELEEGKTQDALRVMRRETAPNIPTL
jgi:hypothetical protein